MRPKNKSAAIHMIKRICTWCCICLSWRCSFHLGVYQSYLNMNLHSNGYFVFPRDADVSETGISAANCENKMPTYTYIRSKYTQRHEHLNNAIIKHQQMIVNKYFEVGSLLQIYFVLYRYRHQ